MAVNSRQCIPLQEQNHVECIKHCVKLCFLVSFGRAMKNACNSTSTQIKITINSSCRGCRISFELIQLLSLLSLQQTVKKYLILYLWNGIIEFQIFVFLCVIYKFCHFKRAFLYVLPSDIIDSDWRHYW